MDFSVIKSHSAKHEKLRMAIESNDLIFITGPPSVGKTTLAVKVLSDDLAYTYAYINCNDIVTPSKLYIDISKSLAKEYRSRLRKLPDKVMAGSDFVDFFESFHELIRRKGVQRIYVILDQIEFFRKASMTDCIVFLAQVEHLSLMLISNETSDDVLDYIKQVSVRSKIQDRLNLIQLPPWTKSDLTEMICKQLPTKQTELYKKFVHNIVSIVYTENTRDFLEIRTFCQENFSTFLDYYMDQMRALIKKNEKLSLDDTELDEEAIEEFAVTHSYARSIIGSFLETLKNIVRQKDIQNWKSLRAVLRVAPNTIVLIASTYIAAYTTPSCDKRNFVKFQKRKLTKRGRLDPGERENFSRPFTLERLIQIYKGLSNLSQGKADYEKPSPMDFTDSVLSDVQLLEDLDIIQIVTGDGLDSLTRYRISEYVSKEYVEKLIEQLGDISLDHVYGLN